MLYVSDWLTKPKSERQHLLTAYVRGLSSDDVDFVKLVEADDGFGVYASTGHAFMYAVFGRDSIVVAEDLLDTHRQLARDVILTLATLQGTKVDMISEEEPGKIHHEFRTRQIGSHMTPDDLMQIVYDHDTWRSDEDKAKDQLLYYGTTDATPLYVRLIDQYVSRYGADILYERYIDRDGNEHAVIDSARKAVHWLAARIKRSEWGLLEYRRMNPLGLENQVWKDGWTSYVHADGSFANHDGGIASVELQGYAYDALMAASELLAHSEAEAEDWQRLAAGVQRQTLDLMWMPDAKFFAQGLDRYSDGDQFVKAATRQITTLTSNAGELLDSNLLIDLPDEEREKYVKPLVEKLLSWEFMTEAGVRCRSIRHKGILRVPDYQGVHTSWPKDTQEIAKGLRRHGYGRDAERLESLMLEAVTRAGEFYEYFFVNEEGRVYYDPAEAMELFRQTFTEHIDLPQAGQAWTISAVESIVDGRMLLLEQELADGAHAYETAAQYN